MPNINDMYQNYLERIILEEYQVFEPSHDETEIPEENSHRVQRTHTFNVKKVNKDALLYLTGYMARRFKEKDNLGVATNAMPRLAEFRLERKSVVPQASKILDYDFNRMHGIWKILI